MFEGGFKKFEEKSGKFTSHRDNQKLREEIGDKQGLNQCKVCDVRCNSCPSSF